MPPKLCSAVVFCPYVTRFETYLPNILMRMYQFRYIITHTTISTCNVSTPWSQHLKRKAVMKYYVLLVCLLHDQSSICLKISLVIGIRRLCLPYQFNISGDRADGREQVITTFHLCLHVLTRANPELGQPGPTSFFA